MSFRDIKLQLSYSTDFNNIAVDFYSKVFRHTVKYKRAVAYFNSGALVEILEGLRDIIANNGKIQFLISPQISKEDAEAIEEGYLSREKAINNSFSKSLDDLKNASNDKFNLLVWLIENEYLDIKFVLHRKNARGIFHEKLGILYDKDGNTICFHGSNNETVQAMGFNYESFDVFVSWEEREYSRIHQKEIQFEKLWNNRSTNWESHFISNEIKERIRSYYNKMVVNLDIVENNKSKNHLPLAPSWLKLRDYQKEAINSWFENGARGLFQMATGTGKTITAISAMTRLATHYIQHGKQIAFIVVVPYKVLLEQWDRELANFNIDSVKCYDSRNSWSNTLDGMITLFNGDSKKFLCVLTTNATFKRKHLKDKINRIQGDMVICIDEVHNFTSKDSLDALPEKARYRLGLSATLENEYKEDEIEKLKEYFGNRIVFEYSLEKAISNNFLTKYYYYPVFVDLNMDEKKEYYKISRNICIALNGRDESRERLMALFKKRSRLVASADSKISILQTFKDNLLDSYHNIIYCGDRIEDDGRFIEKVNLTIAKEIGISTHMFTSAQTRNERERILEDFKTKKIQALTAIRCLDEGVDIPQLQTAYILSSGSNPKEFIQRRGRILRKAPNKTHATIYDVFVVPTLNRNELMILDDKLKETEKRIINKELIRFSEFAKLSINAHEAYNKVFRILELYK